MKNPAYLIILLALGLVAVSYNWIASTRSTETYAATTDSLAASSTIADIMTRASVRSYTDRPVSRELIDTLLRAAMAAPTAANKQPWRFVVIDNRDILNYIADNFHTMTMMKEARVAVVVCGDLNSTLEGNGRDYWIQDGSAATENLLLAAHALGLGAVWCGVYPQPDRVSRFSELLHLPADILPLNCIAIGYPKGETAPKDKWRPDFIRYNTWDE